MGKLSSIIPLVIVVILIGIIGFVGFIAYSIANDVGTKTRQKLERKNVSFSRDGMKVGVKEVTIEQQEDTTQSVLVKIWNNSTWPNYQSRLGWGQYNATQEKKNPLSRSSSATSSKATGSTPVPSRTNSATAVRRA